MSLKRRILLAAEQTLFVSFVHSQLQGGEGDLQECFPLPFWGLLICHTSHVREKPLRLKCWAIHLSKSTMNCSYTFEVWLWHLTAICSCAGNLFWVTGLSDENKNKTKIKSNKQPPPPSKLQGLFWGLSEITHMYVRRTIFYFYERSFILVSFHRNYPYLPVTYTVETPSC